MEEKEEEEEEKEVKTEQNTSFPTKFSTQLVKKFYYWKAAPPGAPFSNDLKNGILTPAKFQDDV